MFRATLCSSSGGQFYEYNVWYNHSVLVAVRYTGRPLTQSDSNKRIEKIVHQVGYVSELYEDARSEKYLKKKN